MQHRVLVVDDEVDIVEGLTTMFEFESIEAAGAGDCDAALAMLTDLYYPVILADLRLRSEEEGLRLLDAIRERTPRSRVVMLTAYATPAVEDELLKRGVAMVLHKPAPCDVILEAIQALLEELEREAGAENVQLDELYVTLRRRLYDIPRRRFGLSHAVAEDVVQDAWLLFLRKRGLIREARPWLAGTVANLARQQIDRKVRKREDADEEVMAAVVDDRGGSITDVIAVRAALAQAEDRVRALCSLIGLEGRSYEEVSIATGIPLGSVGPLYIRAKKKLQEILAN